MARPKSGIERKRRVLYCASNMTNKELVELIETGVNESGPCTECDSLRDELSKCAQKPIEQSVNVHNNDSLSAQKPAFTPNYVKNGIDMAALQAIASGNTAPKVIVQDNDDEFITAPRMGNRDADKLVNRFIELMRKGASVANCTYALNQLEDTLN